MLGLEGCCQWTTGTPTYELGSSQFSYRTDAITEVLFSPITSIFPLLNIHFHNYSSVL